MQVYQYNSNGYYVGVTKAYKGFLPNNTTTTEAVFKDGYIPKWNGESWKQIENHVGTKGYLDGEEYTINDYGALPAGFSLEAPLPSLEEAKEQKIEELKNARNAEEQDFAIYNDIKYDCDQESILRITVAKMTYTQPVPWTDYNNQVQELTLEDFDGLLGAIALHAGTVHYKYNLLKAKIEDMQDVESILAIEWV